MRAASQAASRFRTRKVPRLPGPYIIDAEYIDVEATPIPSTDNTTLMLQQPPSVSSPATLPPIPPHVLTMGALIGIPETIITKALENFIKVPDLEGCPRVIERCFNELSHLPGFNQLMSKALKESAMGDVARGKGSLNELRSALVFKDQNYNPLELEGREIGKYRADIITDKYLVECKNWDFEKLAENPAKFNKRIDRIIDQLANATAAGKLVSKKIMFMSKKKSQRM